MLQSDLDKLKLSDLAGIPEVTTAKFFTDVDQTCAAAESERTDDEKILNHYQELYSINVSSDNDGEESNEEPRPLKRTLQIFASLLQNCSIFEEENVLPYFRNCLDKFSILYEKL